MLCRFFVFVFSGRPADSGGITDSHLTSLTSSTDYNLIGCLHDWNTVQTCWTYCWVMLTLSLMILTVLIVQKYIYRYTLYAYSFTCRHPKTLYVQM